MTETGVEAKARDGADGQMLPVSMLANAERGLSLRRVARSGDHRGFF